MTTSTKHSEAKSSVRFRFPTYVFALLSVITMVALIWAPFGLKRAVGLFEEYFTEGNPSSSVEYLVGRDPTRPFTFAPFVFAQSLTPNSFAGHNLFMMLLFVLKGMVVYKLLYRLFPQDRFLALLAGCLFVIYPADSALMTFRALNIHLSIALGLLSIYLLVAQWQEPQKWRRVPILALQFVSLGIYEVMYGIILAAPVLLLWQERRFSRRLIRAALLWWALPTLMALRMVYFITKGGSNYVSGRLKSGTQTDFTLNTVWHSLSKMYERHVTAWGYAFDEISLSSRYTIYALMAGIVVAIVAWQHWRKGEATRSKVDWQANLLLVLAGLALMGVSFAPYLPTPYRNATFRVFYLSSLGASLALASLVHWGLSYMRRYAQLPAAVIAGVLVMLGTHNAIGQLDFFVRASDSVQRMFAGILTAAPSVPDPNSIIVFVDETLEYQDGWHLGGSTSNFFSALQFLYYDDDLRSRFCIVAPERPTSYCVFRSDELWAYDEAGGLITIPYPQVIVIRTDYHGGFELLEEIPEEYIVRDDSWADNLMYYDPHRLIEEDAPLPARAYTFFTCWPVDDCLPPVADKTPQSAIRLDFDHMLPGPGWELPVPGQTRLWTTSRLAVLNLNIAPAATSYGIQFSIAYALDPAILDSLALRVNGTTIPLQRSDLASGEYIFDGLIPAEVIAANLQNTKLVFSTERVVSPKELGLGADIRSLGVLFDWLTIEPVADAVNIEFDAPVAGTGWYTPEASQAWTSSTTTTLDVRVATQQDLTVGFRITYALSDEIINSLQFSANGVPLPLDVRRDDAAAYLYWTVIPQAVLDASADGMLHLQFTIAATANPAALGINNDTRDLGLLFDWVRIKPLVGSARVEFDTPAAGTGWYAPEASEMWMSAAEATLNVEVDTRRPLNAEFRVSYAPTDDLLNSLQCSANGVVLQLTVRRDATGGYVYQTVVPQSALDVGQSGLVHLKFSIAATANPAALGTGSDVRDLGLKFDWLALDPLANTARVEFDTPMTDAGWHLPDGSESWMSRPESTLDVWVNTQQDLIAEFRVTAMLTDDMLNSLQFAVNDTVLPLEREQDEAGAFIFRATIPQAILAASEFGQVRLKLSIAATANPSDMGLNADIRDLGLKFDWLELRPVTEP